jgi:cytosine/adenosine deaminase-related metal-dependent hydrolase
MAGSGPPSDLRRPDPFRLDSSSGGFLRLTASRVLTLEGEPVANGAVLVGADGRVAEVGMDSAVSCPEGTRVEALGDVVLLPGLVNAHTHLELTGLPAGDSPADFPRWIRRIRELKERRTAEEYRAAARTGLQDCWSAGITTIADTGDSGAVIEALHQMGGRGIVYQEVFGPHPDQLRSSMALLERTLERLAQFSSERVRLGVSPHAPYTVSGPLYRAVGELADRDDLPVAVHLAESPAESELIRSGAGPFADAWRARGIPLPEDTRHLDRPFPVRTPVRWLEAHGVLGPETLCIHAVQVDAADIAVLAKNDGAIAHCPLSNRAHQHGEAPLGALLAAGLRVGIGTDSTASVGRLDLLAEARAARSLAGLSAERALRLVTLEGAMAIGFTDIGLIAPGAWADLTAVDCGPLPGAVDAESVAEAVLQTGPDAVVATWVAGREVYRA